MKLAHLIDGLPGVALVAGDGAVEITAVAHDSRAIGPGTLFVALPGRTVDGRRFLDKALAAGAAAVAVPVDDGPFAETITALAGRAPVVRLAAPRPDLARLAARINGDPAQALTLLGLTGTNGKSTVAMLIAGIIEAAGRAPGVIGTLGNQVGEARLSTRFTTPEAPTLHRLLAQMRDAGVSAAAIEVTSVGLAEHRVDGVPFAGAAFLNLTPDHLDYHGDMARYGAAKARLFLELLAPDGVAVIDVDDPFGAALAAQLAEARPAVQIWRLSLERAEVELRYTELTVDGTGIRGTLRTPVGAIPLSSPLLGRFNARNVAVAAALTAAIELPAEAIGEGLARTVVAGRLQRIPDPKGRTVVVDYAHSADALTRVIDTLRPLTPGKLWCVFGCGGDRDRTKRGPMGRAAAAADAVVVTSDNPRSEDPATIAAAAAGGAIEAGRPMVGGPLPGGTWVELDRAEAIEQTIDAARRGDTVLIAGKGHEDYQEIAGVRRPFDDVEVATAALSGRRAR